MRFRDLPADLKAAVAVYRGPILIDVEIFAFREPVYFSAYGIFLLRVDGDI